MGDSRLQVGGAYLRALRNRPVHVLVRGNGVGDELVVHLVDGVQRQLDDEAVDRRVLVGRHDALQDLQDDRRQEVVRTASQTGWSLVRGGF